MTIKKPTLLLDKKRCLQNIEAMVAKADLNNLQLRPHFKTHQSLMVGQWFKEAGIEKITVSSVSMAQYFATEWWDITIAFPVNILEIDEINELAKSRKIQLLVESVETAQFLAEHTKYAMGIFVKIEVGAGRSGIKPENTSLIDQIIAISDESEYLSFEGFLAHAGHTYQCRSYQEVEAIHQQACELMIGLKKHYQANYPDLSISLGDTPSCSVSDHWEGIDEMRPGNFVFYDLMQAQITSCDIDQIAVAVACPIVALHEDRNELVVYGGGVHFSKDFIMEEELGRVYGKVAKPQGDSWGDLEEGMYVKRLSQEHGIISIPEHKKGVYRVGDCLTVLPVHSCMTADLLRSYHLVED